MNIDQHGKQRHKTFDMDEVLTLINKAEPKPVLKTSRLEQFLNKERNYTLLKGEEGI